MERNVEQIEVNGKTFDIRVQIDDGEKFYALIDFGKLVKIKHVASSFQCIDPVFKRQLVTQTRGGPQLMTYVNKEGIRRFLLRSRSVAALDIGKMFDVNLLQDRVVPVELCTITSIMKAFKGERMIHQYATGNYRIDLYFEDYKLAVECDEERHKLHQDYDEKREKILKQELGCSFIRYSPQNEGFDIFDVINTIHKFIVKSKTTYEVCKVITTKVYDNISIHVYGTYCDPLFDADEIATLLSLHDISTMIEDYDKKYKVTKKIVSNGVVREANMLTEQGLYKFVFTSNIQFSVLIEDRVFSLIRDIRCEEFSAHNEVLKTINNQAQQIKVLKHQLDSQERTTDCNGDTSSHNTTNNINVNINIDAATSKQFDMK